MFVNEISLHCFVVVMCLAKSVEATIDMEPVNFGKISTTRCNASVLAMFADDMFAFSASLWWISRELTLTQDDDHEIKMRT